MVTINLMAHQRFTTTLMPQLDAVDTHLRAAPVLRSHAVEHLPDNGCFLSEEYRRVHY